MVSSAIKVALLVVTCVASWARSDLRLAETNACGIIAATQRALVEPPMATEP